MKRSLGEQIFSVVNYFMITVLSCIMLYPYLNQLAIALNDPNDAMKGNITVFPRVFTLKNFETVLHTNSILSGIKISVLYVVLATAIALFVTTAVAYVLSKKNLPGRKLFVALFLIPQFISGGLIPTYILYRYLHLLDNFLVYILPACFSFYNMLIIKAYIGSIPDSLEESALIDGANEVKVLFRIYMPLAQPVLATVTLWLVVGYWNDWNTALFFVTNRNLFPLQYILMKIIKETEQVQRIIAEEAMKGNTSSARGYVPTPQTIQAAILIVATLPIICAYPFLQKYFVSGIMLGSVKA